jgi:branched-chain amino acid transport system ATP-binding protein
MTILLINKINTFYGLSHILFDVSLELQEGETVCLLGRNGVGKSTTLKSIMGLVQPQSGSIKFFRREIKSLATYRISRLGIGYVPENRLIFPDLTVRENLIIGAKSGDNGQDWTLEKIYQVFPILKEREAQDGGTLSGGEQQMLTIARTLMGNPKLILLDEPSEGLAPLIMRAVYETVKRLREKSISILLSEQNADFALKLSNRAYILEKGQISWSGVASELISTPEITKKYLGV